MALSVSVARLNAASEGAQHGVSVLQFVGVILHPQQGSNAGEQFDRKDGFVKEIIGAGFNAANLVLAVAQPGNHDDGNQARFGNALPFAAKFISTFFGHHHIQQNQVGCGIPHNFFGNGGTGGNQHFVALAAKQFSHEQSVLEMIVHN